MREDIVERIERGETSPRLGRTRIMPPTKCFRYVLRLMKRNGRVIRLHLSRNEHHT